MAVKLLLRWLFITTTLLLVAPVSACALSMYDIIQLIKKDYSDQDIVSLIIMAVATSTTGINSFYPARR